MALVLISVIVLVIPQLFEIVTLGSREQLPVDFVSIVGASVLMVAGFATAVLHRHRFSMFDAFSRRACGIAILRAFLGPRSR